MKKPEEVPDKDKLFYHIPIARFTPFFDFSDVPPHAFTPQGDDGLSVNWEKYCPSAQDCMSIPTNRYPDGRSAKTHGIGHFIASEVRTINSLQVIYSPLIDNKAHSLIAGIPSRKPKAPYNEMRKNLKRIFKHWDIHPDPATKA